MDTAQAIADDIDAVVRSIWSDEPASIRDLRNGVVDSDAGSFNQYFTTMIFGLIYTIAYGNHVVFDLVRLADQEAIPLESLRTVAHTQLSTGFRSTQFIGYVLDPKVEKFGDRISAAIPEIDSYADLSRMLGSFLTYLNTLHAWLHIIFPWYLGEAFPRRPRPAVSNEVTGGAS